MKKIVLLVAFSFSVIAVAQQTKFQKMDSLLTFLNANNKFMGSFTLRENNQVVFAKAYGYANLEANQKANETTKLKIGSITKTFTATIILQLIEEKKLTQETKLAQFYPHIPNADKITIHQLLHHRTGILDYLNGDSTSVNVIQRYNSKAEMIARITAYKPIFEPNSKYEYSNSNYYLLGAIIEEVTKKSFAANLNSRIFDKIGLKNTSFPTKIDSNKNEAYSYTYIGKTWLKTPEWDNSIAFAAGAISSTPSDLTAFISALFDGKLVSKESLEAMKTMEDGYGEGLIIAPFNKKKFYGHTGGIENFRAFLGYNPEDKVGLSLLVNGDNFNNNDIMIGLLSLFYEKPYVFPNVTELQVKNEILQKYVGTYTSATLPLKITVFVENGTLMAQATGQGSFPLTAKSETEFEFTAAGIQMNFADNQFILKQAGMEHRYTKE